MNEQGTKKSWKEKVKATWQAFGNLPGAFKIVGKAYPAGTVSLVIMTLLAALLPVGQAWVGKLIVDSVLLSFANGLSPQAGLGAALPLLLLEFGMLSVTMMQEQIRLFLNQVINARIEHYLNTQLMSKALELDLSYFEDASFYDKLRNAQREIGYRPMAIVTTSFQLVQYFITLASVVFILFALSPLIALILFLSGLPSFIIQVRYSKFRFRVNDWRAPEARRNTYLENLLTSDSSIKELKLFGIGETLLRRYSSLYLKFYREDRDMAFKRMVLGLLWSLLGSLGFYGAYCWIILTTLSGAISVGSMIFYLAVFRQSQIAFQGIFGGAGQLYEGNLFMKNLFDFLNLKPRSPQPNATRPLPQRIEEGIEFRNVSFRYPGKETWALRNLNLRIAPGQKVALVGSNGAGKTTLVKLLTRLYEPTEGQILLDGVDLRDYDLHALRQRIGVIFQDFVRYEFTARENIGFGQIEHLEDTGRIVEAARRGGADEVLKRLPQGYESMLGNRFENGQQLSGGEWQKVALSRAFMRDSELLVLDEPTSALDADAEYEVFERIRELTDGKMALFISHRFSTVRMANQIAVLENGEITELGTHYQLLAQGGTYARLFDLQAAGYR